MPNTKILIPFDGTRFIQISGKQIRLITPQKEIIAFSSAESPIISAQKMSKIHIFAVTDTDLIIYDINQSEFKTSVKLSDISPKHKVIKIIPHWTPDKILVATDKGLLSGKIIDDTKLGFKKCKQTFENISAIGVKEVNSSSEYLVIAGQKLYIGATDSVTKDIEFQQPYELALRGNFANSCYFSEQDAFVLWNNDRLCIVFKTSAGWNQEDIYFPQSLARYTKENIFLEKREPLKFRVFLAEKEADSIIYLTFSFNSYKRHELKTDELAVLTNHTDRIKALTFLTSEIDKLPITLLSTPNKDASSSIVGSLVRSISSAIISPKNTAATSPSLERQTHVRRSSSFTTTAAHAASLSANISNVSLNNNSLTILLSSGETQIIKRNINTRKVQYLFNSTKAAFLEMGDKQDTLFIYDTVSKKTIAYTEHSGKITLHNFDTPNKITFSISGDGFCLNDISWTFELELRQTQSAIPSRITPN